MLAVDVLEAPSRLRGEPLTVLRPSLDWQLFERDREKYGRVFDWYTLEGPFVVHRGDRYWCFYSGGSWQRPSYAVGVATATHPLGPWTEPSPARRVLETVPGHVLGPCHNSVVAGPDGDDVIVYHAWDHNFTARRMWIDSLTWTDDGPVVRGRRGNPPDICRVAWPHASPRDQRRTVCPSPVERSRSTEDRSRAFRRDSRTECRSGAPR